MGFRQLFEFLQQTYDLSDDLAWKLCIKAKRGTADQSKPGAFTKDLAYFKGEREVVKFLKDGGGIKDLYVGKITIGDLELVRAYGGLVEAKFLL